MLIVLLAGFVLALLPATAAQAADGDLDPTFGSSGTQTTSFGADRQDQGYAVAVQPDRKVVVAGDSYNGTGYDIALVRYTEFGELDPTFGAGGMVTTSFSGRGAVARAVAIQADGNIVVAGGIATPGQVTPGDVLLLRYAPDGTLDPTFGAGGIVTTVFGPRGSHASAIGIQADGKIVVAGTSGAPARNEFALARYETDGTLDATFGGGGRVTTSFGVFTNQGDTAKALAIQPDGKIVVAGYTAMGDGLHVALARYQTDGALDPLFYGGGIHDVPPGRVIGVARGSWADAIAVQADGKILAGGSNKDGQFMLARYGMFGAPDLSFGSLGTVTTVLSPGLSADEVFTLALQTDGKIIAAGLSHNGTDFDYGLARYQANGALDPAFGTGGIVKTGIVPPTPGNAFTGGDIANAAAIAPDGRLVVAGYSSVDGVSGFKYIFSAARYLTGLGPPPPDPRADLSLEMVVSTLEPPIGSDVTFTLTLHNRGPADATGVSVRAVLPFTLTFQSAPGGTFVPGAGIVWNVGAVPSGASHVLTLVARATGAAPGGLVFAEVMTSDQQDPDSTPGNGGVVEDDQARLTVSPKELAPADLSLGVASESMSPLVGVNTRLTLTIANAGPGEAPGVAARVDLSPELVLVAVNPAAEYDVVTRTWTVGTLAAGAGASLELIVRRTVNFPASVFAQVTASLAPDPDSFPNNGAGPEDDNATLTFLAAKADLSLELESTLAQPVPGIHARFVVTAINDGPADVTDVRVSFTLPAGLTVLSADPAVEFAGSFWTVGDLAGSARRTLTLVVRPERPGVHITTAEVHSSAGAADPDSVPGNHNPAEDDQKSVTLDIGAAPGDADGDGLPDVWETDGIDVNADGVVDVPLHEAPFNANPMHKDVFVELDWMAASPPDPAALADVVAAFAAAPVANPDAVDGITLHIITDETLPDIPALAFDRGGPGSFDAVKLGEAAAPCDGAFGTEAERLDVNCVHALAARRLAFHYVIYGQLMDGFGSASGIAELPGNDFLITLAGWSPEAIVAAGGRRAVEAGVFMHELGHNLGLHHGGADDVNCKPNYLSAMNYALTFPEVDPARPLDFSRAELPTLDENDLSEAGGAGGPPGRSVVYATGAVTRRGPAMGPIDWDGSGTADGVGVSADISAIAGLCAPGLDVLRGHDDWAHLLYDFRGSPDFAEGPRTTPHAEPEITEEQVLAVAETLIPLLVARDDAYSTRQNHPLFVARPGVLSNDTHSGGSALRAFLVHRAAHGFVLRIRNGGFVYLPKPGFVGTDTFTYNATDGVHTSNTATVTITVARK